VFNNNNNNKRKTTKYMFRLDNVSDLIIHELDTREAVELARDRSPVGLEVTSHVAATSLSALQ